MEWTSIICSVITGALALVGVLVANRKTEGILEYRLQALEKKVDEQNKFAEEIQQIKEAIVALQKDVENLKKEK